LDERVLEAEERPLVRHSILRCLVLEGEADWHSKVCHWPPVEEAEASKKREPGVVDEDAVAVSMNLRLHTAHHNFAAVACMLVAESESVGWGRKDCSQLKPYSLGKRMAVALAQQVECNQHVLYRDPEQLE
jgi:hypothetical protein